MATARKVSKRRPTSKSTTRRAGNDIVTTTMVRVHLPGAGRRNPIKSTGTRRRNAKAKGGRRTRR